MMDELHILYHLIQGIGDCFSHNLQTAINVCINHKLFTGFE